MLTTDNIIDLYDKQEFSTIISNVKMREGFHISDLERILLYAIDTDNIDLFKHTFTITNVSDLIIRVMLSKSNLLFCSALESILESDSTLCADIKHKLEFYSCSANSIHWIPIDNNILMLNIVIKYLACDMIIRRLIIYSICNNNTHMIDIISDHGYDIKSEFDILMYSKYSAFNIKFDTLIFLKKYTDILPHINRIGEIVYHSNDLIGLQYCLENGADVNYILASNKMKSSEQTIQLIKYMLNYGADLNLISFQELVYITDSSNLDIIIFLVENGFNIDTHLDELMLIAISFHEFDIMKYLINLGADIHYQDDQALFHAVGVGNIKCLELLLDLGANIHVDNDSILLFTDGGHRYRNIDLDYGNWLLIAKCLIKYGAVMSDPTRVLYSFSCVYNICPIDEELFTYCLDHKIDFDMEINGEYILDTIVDYDLIPLIKSCLQYGVNLTKNNNLLRIAIQINSIEMVRLLLDIGCHIDSNFNYDFASTEIINLLDVHNLNIFYLFKLSGIFQNSLATHS